MQLAFPGGAGLPRRRHPHPRTGAYLATAWGHPFYREQIADHRGVPTLAGCFGTDALVPGW